MGAAYKVLTVLIAGTTAGFASIFAAGSIAQAPAPAIVGAPQADLPVEAISIESGSGRPA